MNNSNKSNQLKCFVVFNYSEYTVIFDNFIEDGIKLKKLITKLSKTIGSEISTKTHSFQIFNPKSNRLQSKRVLIRDLARVSVSVKQNQNNNKSNNNPILNQLTIRWDFANKSKAILKKLDKMNNLFIQTVQKSVKDSTIDWKSVSNQMKKIFGYNQLNENECKKLMNELTEKFVQTLVDSNKSGLTAISWELFYVFLNIDLKAFIKPEMFATVSQMRDKFLFNVRQQNRLNAPEVPKPVLNDDSDSIDSMDSYLANIKPYYGISVKKEIEFKTNDDNLQKPSVGQEFNDSFQSNTDRKPQNINEIAFNDIPSFSGVKKAKVEPNLSNSSELELTSNLYQSDSKPVFNKSSNLGSMAGYSGNIRPVYETTAEKKPKLVTNYPKDKKRTKYKNRSNKSNVKYKCIVEVYDSKYNFVGHNCGFGYQLRQVLKNQLQQKTDWNISFNTHLFEIYDENTDSYLELNHQNHKNDRDVRVRVSVDPSFDNCNEENKRLIESISQMSNDWNPVSNTMQSFGFDNFNESLCKSRFNSLILQYMTVLKTFDNESNASTFWPLFDSIHRLDLHELCDNSTHSKIQAIISGSDTDQHIKPLSFHELKPNRRQYFMNLCFDENFRQLIQTTIINKTRLRTNLLNCSTIEEQIRVFREEVLLTANDIKNRTELKNILETLLKESGIDCVVHTFGSTANCVGFCNSDIDLFIEIKELNNCFERLNFQTAFRCLYDFTTIFKRCLNFQIPNPIRSRRCPIIKVDFNNMIDKKVNNSKVHQLPEKSVVSCDISISSGLGIQNSRLIQLYCEDEPRFQELAIILRFWAKSNGFIDGMNAFTSYAFTQLVIYFCQNLSPPLLMTVNQLRQLTNQSLIVDGWECGFCTDKNPIRNVRNNESVIELLPKFFKFYSNFDFTTQVIQTRTGLSVHKSLFKSSIRIQTKKRSANNLQFKMTAICCIEDPFDLEHNLTTNLRFEVFDRFLEFIKHIALNSDLIFSLNLANNSTTDWGILKIISNFDPTNNYKSTLGRNIFTPNVIQVIESSETCAQQLIQTIANDFFDLTFMLLKDVYKIWPKFTPKSEIISGEMSTFSEFTIDLKGIDLQIIDINNRQLVTSELKSKLRSKDRLTKERIITNEIVNRYKGKEEPKTSIKCRFSLICNARPSGPYIEYKINELSPNSTYVKRFFATFVHSLPHFKQSL